MIKSKYSVPLTMLWGAILLVGGLWLGDYWMKQEISDNTERILLRSTAIIPIIAGAIAFGANLIVYLIYIYCFLFKKDVLRARKDLLVTKAHFVADVFYLEKVYEAVSIPRNEQGHNKYLRKRLAFLEKEYGYQYSFSKDIVSTDQGYGQEVFLLHRYLNRQAGMQLLFVGAKSGEVHNAYIIKGTMDTRLAFDDPARWLSLQEIADFQSQGLRYFNLQDAVDEPAPVKDLLAFEYILKQNKPLLTGQSWPSVADNKRFLPAINNWLMDLKEKMEFLTREYGFHLLNDPASILPYYPDYTTTSLVYESADKTKKIEIVDYEEEIDHFYVQWTDKAKDQTSVLEEDGTASDNIHKIRSFLNTLLSGGKTVN